MNSLEFIIPQSFLFIFTNLSFLFFCFILSYIISKIARSFMVFVILFIGLTSFAYYDLYLKYAIKNYYELTQSEIQKVDLNSNLRSSLSLTSDEKSKFLVEKNTQETIFPKIYLNHEFKFIDKSTKEVIATAFTISFVIEHHKFRNRYLYWGFEKEDEFNPDSIGNFDYVYKKILQDDIKGSVK